MTSSHAWDDDGCRFSGTIPSARTLMTYSETSSIEVRLSGNGR